MKTTAIILSAAILAGCANTGAQYQPLVDGRTQGANYLFERKAPGFSPGM